MRLKLLEKLAQVAAVPTSPASPPSPASPASPTSPTQPTSTTQPATLQAPPYFDCTSNTWAWVNSRYNSSTIGFLKDLFNKTNIVMHYGSEGKISFTKNQNNMGTVDPSGLSSPDGKNAVNFGKLLYSTFINGGKDFQPTPEQINQWCDTLPNAPPLMQLSQLNPTGPAAQQMQLQDPFKQTVTNLLTRIKSYNPVQQRRL